MTILIYVGTVTTILGLCGLIYCITSAAKIKKAADEASAKAGMRRLVAINMISVAVAFFGLAFVVIGVML